MSNPFRYFNSSPEVIRLAVMMYVKYPLSLRNVEDLLSERGIDISTETVRFWWNRFGPIFAAEIRKRRVAHMRGYPQWRWHLDEVFAKDVLEEGRQAGKGAEADGRMPEGTGDRFGGRSRRRWPRVRDPKRQIAAIEQIQKD